MYPLWGISAEFSLACVPLLNFHWLVYLSENRVLDYEKIIYNVNSLYSRNLLCHILFINPNNGWQINILKMIFYIFDVKTMEGILIPFIAKLVKRQVRKRQTKLNKCHQSWDVFSAWHLPFILLYLLCYNLSIDPKHHKKLKYSTVYNGPHLDKAKIGALKMFMAVPDYLKRTCTILLMSWLGLFSGQMLQIACCYILRAQSHNTWQKPASQPDTHTSDAN